MPHASRVNRAMVHAARSLPNVTVHDLYETYPDFHIDVPREQALMQAADLIVFQHPIQWYGMPSLLKEWVDAVLEVGWAYGQGSAAIWAAVVFFQSDAGSINRLLGRMADILERSRDQIPLWMKGHLPENVDQMRVMATDWLRSHAVEAKWFGEQAGRVAVHLLLGMIIGAMVALHDSTDEPHARRPLACALRERLVRLQQAFERIVFAQVQIAAINAGMMALYLLVILPLAGISLPLTKSLIVVTFLAGLIPVAGNLISNAMLVIVALSISPQVAAVSLLFMVVVHKLEYFLNARIVGAKIEARPWELLVAILVMETVFGLPGLVAAPVFYAYLKQELMARELV